VSVTVRLVAGMRNTSPSLIVRDVVSGAQANMLPPVDASKIAACVMVPQLPPDAAANSMAASFVAVVAVPDTVMVPVALRAYALPDTSVPPPGSLGAAVKRPTYHAVGRVAELVVNSQLSTRLSV